MRSWLVNQGRLPVKQAIELGLGIVRGIQHVTGKVPGLVHRDLKPENVLVGRDGRELGERRLEEAGLTHLGLAYAALGDARRAIGCYARRLEIAREIGDRVGEANGRFNLALLLAQQGERAKAREHASAALGFFTAIGHADCAARVEALTQL